MIELSDIKRHLNVDFDEDDLLIESMIKAVQASMEHTIGASLSELMKDGKLPDDLLHVFRIMVAKLYEYREGNTYGKVQDVSFTLSHLLAPYIKVS